MTIAIIEKMMVKILPTSKVAATIGAGENSLWSKATEPMITSTVSASMNICAGLVKSMTISINVK